jgi:heme exporter protein A
MADVSAGLHIDSISCSRGYRDLFEGLSFSLSAGQVLRVEGRNGSGKTSLLRIMAGLAQPLQGDVLWQGRKISHPESDYFRQLLFIGHRPGIKFELTPLENLAMAVALNGSNEAMSLDDALYQVGLYGFEDTPCARLSAGQKRRVALAQLYLSNARVWILDEPYTSLDVAAVAVLEQRFVQHIEQGGILVITSHQPVNLDAGTQYRLRLPNTQLEALS